MVAYGVGQEVACCLFVGELDDLLGAAQVGLALVLNQDAFFGKMTAQVSACLEDGNWARLHETAYSHAYSRLKMGVELKAVDHVEWYGAVSKEQFACLRVDAGWIGLETALAGHGLCYLHRQHGGDVALAASHDAL